MALTAALALFDRATMPSHDVISEGPWWLAWNFDPIVVIPVALAAFYYARGLHRWDERSRLHSRWRVTSYYTGLVVLLLSVQSPLDRLGEHHFSMHMVQHNVVMMLVPPLILLGAPTTPMLRGLPRWVRKRIVTPTLRSSVGRGAWRVLTFPIVALGMFTLLQWLWHLMPGWYDAALNNNALHLFQHFSFFAISMIFWWNIIDPKPLRSRIPLGFRILYFYGAMIPKHILAAMITFSPEPLYETYTRVHLFLPWDALQDQEIAGLLMWVPFGEAINLTVAAILFRVWWRQSERQTIEDERRRDEQRAREASAVTPGATSAG
ncbi:MAG: cytochrome c oxidase assembly protein [Chloroflexi bacterium]|nr:cytochrome c oxidase assembly protein [Chloroflexota bacterium]MDA1240063.1 cytochrome c oxidase assembly protein [Chloroflexota bacterium]MQC25586.1 cytochrome c oxidase assembly protein [Chloroflexota bacterium]MQC48131.1 cytochrome c oxidase assembly protein [Chloroflexota bacterium]